MQNPLDNVEPLGRYILKHLLGEGGTSKVYLATDPDLGRDIAIKCFDLNNGDARQMERIEHEAVLSAQLNHPNIVQMYDVVKNEQTLGLVMEYVQGSTLSEKLKQKLPDQTQALTWLVQIADGLTKAHQSGIIHCDLKLDNVIVNTDNTAKIADFGIGKVVSHDKLNQAAQQDAKLVSGSYLSISPEQAQGKSLDFRTDVFSFGILSYQLLTGRHPFGAHKDHQAIMHRIVNERFEFSAADSQSLSPLLLQLISALLEKKPEDRPSNMASVSATLKQALDQQRDAEDYDDKTIIFEAVKPNSIWQNSAVRKVGIALAVGVVSVTVFLNWPKSPQQTQYVAITDPTIKVVDGFDPDFKRQIVATLKTSLQEGLIGLDHISLIPDSNLDAYDGSIPNFARAVAADAVLKMSADCSRTQCQVNLQKLGGDDEWAVQEFQEWPIVTESLTDIRSTTLGALSSMFESSGSFLKELKIDEDTYREYLEIQKDSGAGADASSNHLELLEKMRINATSFAPLYELYKRLAINLYKTSGNGAYLQSALDFMEKAPLSVSKSTVFVEAKFDIALAQREIDRAKELIADATESGLDRVTLNAMRAELAYQNGNYKTAVEIERKNIELRPSLDGFYNLAISEFTLGNMNLARQSVLRALTIAPNDSDSHNLLATISLNEGDIDSAISSYHALVQKNSDSYSLANLGLSHMLKGNFEESTKYQRLALESNPTNPASLINLADSYTLEGNTGSAKDIYYQVIELTSDLTNTTYIHYRAQALAHLGEFNQAIKVLKLAEEKNASTVELAYSAAIVHSLAGNHSAAIVEIENAINGGTGPIWFQLKWFEELCAYPKFIELIGTDLNILCNAES